MTTAMHEEIAERNTPEALLAELAQAGADVTKPKAIRCPYHEDRHPSAGIYAGEDGAYRFKCHGCDVGGDFLDLRARRLGKPVEEVILAYREEAAQDGGRTDWDKAARTSTALPVAKAKPDEPMSLAQIKRKLPGTLEATYRYPGLVVFRCRTAKGKTFLQAKQSGDGWVFGAPPKPWPLYNLSRVKGEDRVVVVEGEKAVHALHDIGIVATTSPCGAGKAPHADWSPLAGKRVVLWPDHDENGREHMQDVSAILEKLDPPAMVSHVRPDLLDLPPKGDVVEFLEMVDDPQAMHDAVDAVIETATPDGPAVEFESYVEDIIAGRFTTEDWPWGALTEATEALRPGTVTMLCGQPEAGKSLWLMNCVIWWLGQGLKVAIYELEEDRNDHMMRALAIHTGNSKLTRPRWVQRHGEEMRALMSEHRQWLDRLGRVIWHSPKELVTVDALIKWVGERAADGCRIICIDPVTALEGSAKPWVTDLRLVIETKAIAVKHRCSIVMVTHPKLGLKRIADLDGLAGSAAFPRFSQCVLALAKHHPPETAPIQQGFGTLEQSFERTLYIRKARHSFGGGSRYAYTFSGETLRFNQIGLIREDDE